jgi:predicted dehydrogenase
VKRRTFLKSSAALASATVVPRHVLGGEGQAAPSDKLAIASIGVGGQGGGLLNDPAISGQSVVALCDADSKRCAQVAKKFAGAELFQDYRRLFDKRKDIDAVVIATPDHMHAVITAMALRAGKHVYVEKPMAHSIEECRVVTALAKKHNRVTQVGNGGHAGEGIRLTREWIQAGAIGAVKEVHCWSDRPGTFWKQGLERPAETPPVPEGMDWDLWLGCAPERPYHPTYHPVKWRAWFDFGTGAMGDMAVHNVDPAFYALDLEPPVAVSAETSPLPKETFPLWGIITYEFAAKGSRPAVTMKWYDGGKLPARPEALDADVKLADNGILFVGEKGVILCGGWSGPPTLYPKSLRDGFTPPPKSIPRSIGHRAEWVMACKTNRPEESKAGFAYSGPYTEGLLVGNLAVRLQKRVEYDAVAMKSPNAPEADALIRKTYRKGFELNG